MTKICIIYGSDYTHLPTSSGNPISICTSNLQGTQQVYQSYVAITTMIITCKSKNTSSIIAFRILSVYLPGLRSAWSKSSFLLVIPITSMLFISLYLNNKYTQSYISYFHNHHLLYTTTTNFQCNNLRLSVATHKRQFLCRPEPIHQCKQLIY